MRVDIWSDVRCPFCYIGKRKFEIALDKFAHKGDVEVVWHSFELDPGFKTQTNTNVYDYLAKIKGGTREWSVQVHNQVAQTAKEVGLTYNFDHAVVAASFDAHRLIQLAKTKGAGDSAEEALFKAYFTDGKDISDPDTLAQLGVEIGLDKTVLNEMLNSDSFTKEVRADEAIAQAIGVRGVPHFVINDRYKISGAQSPEVFLETFEHAWKEYALEKPVSDANVCDMDGNC